MKKILCILFSALGITSYSQKSLFWEVSGNGLEKPSYIYGTMHTGDARVYGFKKKVTKVLKKSDFLALELNMDSVNIMSAMSMMVMENDTSLQDLLSEKDYELVNMYFTDSLGMPLSLYDRILPLFTSSMMGTTELGNEMEDPLDTYFFKQAKENDVEVIGLEKVEEQINAFNVVPYHRQAEQLVNTVQQAYENNLSVTDMDSLLHYYTAGDVDKMAELMNEMDDTDPEVSKAMNQVFIIDRNHNMADRAVPYMRKGQTFVAVGAGHLGGPEGIINLLRKMGFTVVPA